MACTKAVIFDYIGTLVNCKGYTMDASKENLHLALVAEGFNISKSNFLRAYDLAHEKYRILRFEQLREVTNAIWVAEALNNLGFKVTPADYRIKCALNVFFKAYVDTFELRECAKKLLKQTQKTFKVGLVSNFTHAPVIHKSLRVLGISNFFNTVVVSEEIGWRKPSCKIFKDALSRLEVDAQEAVYIGDSPIEDIKGAKQAGLKTVFVPSQFSSLEDLAESQQKPDFVAKDLESILIQLAEITGLANL
jgi:putative hydrolase of the HAD superfamily